MFDTLAKQKASVADNGHLKLNPAGGATFVSPVNVPKIAEFSDLFVMMTFTASLWVRFFLYEFKTFLSQ